MYVDPRAGIKWEFYTWFQNRHLRLGPSDFANINIAHRCILAIDSFQLLLAYVITAGTYSEMTLI